MRARLFTALLAITAIVATYLIAEAAFSLAGLPYVPLRLHEYLPEDVRIFAQSSKEAVVPHRPIALFGDSYAQGLGDWLLETDHNRNGPFHSAHVIHALIGRDVITFGRSGAGSATAMVASPVAAYQRSKAAWYLRLPKPDLAVVYFYEGNDLTDNLNFLERNVEKSDAISLEGSIDRALVGYATASPSATNALQHLPLLGFSYRMARSHFEEPSAVSGNREIASNTGHPNLVEVAGATVALPKSLQSPALQLTIAEIDQAVMVYERSLAFLRGLLPGTPVLVVYVPSPLASYRLVGPQVSVQSYFTGRDGLYPKQQVAEYSDGMCFSIRTATVGQGGGFLDLRAAIREASSHDILHGPHDFKHFNRRGMEVLGHAVAERLKTPLAQDQCMTSAS